MSPLPEPASAAPALELLAGLADQSDDDPEGQPLPRLAVGAGLRRAGLATIEEDPDDQAGDRRTTGVVGVEDLGEECTEGHERGVDRLVVADPFRVQGVLDHRRVEDVVKGEGLRVAKEFTCSETWRRVV